MYRSIIMTMFSIFACLTIQTGEIQSEGQGASARIDLYGDPLPPDAIARFKPMASYVECVRFSPDGKRVISGSRALSLWDVESGKRIHSFEKAHTGAVCSMSFSPNGKHVISGSWDTTLALWDVESGRRIRTFETRSLVNSVAWSPDGKCVASAGYEPAPEGAPIVVDGDRDKPKPAILCLWDVENGKLIRRFEGVDESGLKVAFSPDGKTLVAGCNAITLWDLESGKRIRTFEVTYSTLFDSVEFSPDGKRVISGDRNNAICLWDAETGKLIRKFGEQHSGFVYSTAFSPDGRWLVSGSEDSTLAIWDMESGKRIHTFEGHSADVRSVRFSPSGRRIVSGSGDSTVLVWQPFLNEVKEAEGWAREVRGMPAAERKKRFIELIQALATTDYRTLCRTRERVLASGPECLDLLAEVFPPVSDSAYVTKKDHLDQILLDMDANSFEVRNRAQEQLIGYGIEIMDWVKAQRNRKDLSLEVRNRLEVVAKALLTKSLDISVFEVKDLGQIRAVLLLTELQDFDRLRVYEGGSEKSYATHLARRVCGR